MQKQPKRVGTFISVPVPAATATVRRGSLGPGLADDYWTYPKNATVKGLFETLFEGAQGMMGPQRANLTIDEMLLIMSWMRSVYQGDPEKAEWLTPKERENFKPVTHNIAK